MRGGNSPTTVSGDDSGRGRLRRNTERTRTVQSALKVLIKFIVVGLIVYLVFVFFLTPVGLEDFFVPVLLLLSGIASSYIVKELFLGKAVRDIRLSMIILGLTLFLSTLIWNYSPYPGSSLEQSAWGTAIAGLFLSFVIAFRSFSGAYFFVFRSAAIAGLGFALRTLMLYLYPGNASLGDAAFYAMLFSSLLALLALFREHSNPFLRNLGRYFAIDQNALLITLLMIMFFMYVLVLRPLMAVWSPDALVLIEWIFLAVVAGYISYILYSRLKKGSQARIMGDWSRQVQTLAFEKGGLEEATRVVESFVEYGDKEGLIVFLTMVLAENSLSEARIETLLRGIVRYREEEMPLLLRWSYGNHKAKQREDRVRVITDVIMGAVDLLGARHITTPISRLER